MKPIHNYYNVLSKLLLAAAITVYLFAFINLSFFNHPHTDDYIAGYDVANTNLLGYFNKIYMHWGGRYTSILIAGLWAKKHLLFQHYYLHTITLLISNLLSVYLFVYVVNVYLVKKSFQFVDMLLATVTYVVLQITCLPEIVSAYFWFSSAVTYQTGIILLQIVFSLLLIIFHDKRLWVKNIATLLLLILVVLINGCNEVIALIQGLALLTIYFLVRERSDKLIHIIGIIALVYLSSFSLLYIAPGNTERLALIPHSTLPKAIAVAGVRTLYTFWTVFCNPLFWITSVTLLPIAYHIKDTLHDRRWLQWIHGRRAHVFLYAIISIFLIYLPIVYFSNGSFPQRASNVMVQIAVINCFGFIFLISLRVSNEVMKILLIRRRFFNLLTVAIAVTVISNYNFGEAFKSVVAAPLYHKTFLLREQILVKAAKSNSIATLHNYNVVTDSILNADYNGERQLIKDLLVQKPSYLFLYDDLSNTQSVGIIKRYYGVDSLVIKQP